MNKPSTEPPSLGRMAGKTWSFIWYRWYPDKDAFFVDGTLPSRANKTYTPPNSSGVVDMAWCTAAANEKRHASRIGVSSFRTDRWMAAVWRAS